MNTSSYLTSLFAQSFLRRHNAGRARAGLRIASGRRINRAADDAAGMAISQRLSSRIESYRRAETNTVTGLSMARTAESGAASISDTLIRMRELATQAANGDLTSTDRDLLDTEYQALLSEVDRLSDATEFNGTELLAGGSNTIAFQVGTGTSSQDRIDVGFGGISTSSLSIDSTLISDGTGSNATSALSSIDTAIEQVSQKRATFGASVNRLDGAAGAIVRTRTHHQIALSSILDADIASESAAYAQFDIRAKAAASIVAQANQNAGLVLRLLS